MVSERPLRWLELIRSREGCLDIVITEISMPEMGGDLGRRPIGAGSWPGAPSGLPPAFPATPPALAIVSNAQGAATLLDRWEVQR
jgi:hypothetical protein